MFPTENGCVTKKSQFSLKQCPFLRLQGCQYMPRGCYQSRVTRAVPDVGSLWGWGHQGLVAMPW